LVWLLLFVKGYASVENRTVIRSVVVFNNLLTNLLAAMPAMSPAIPGGMPGVMPAGMAGGLPPGWQLAVDAMGRPFYYNYFTQQTSWTPPSATNVPIPPSAMYSVPAPPAAPPVSPAATPPSTAPIDSM
jgi:hypothetical protein